MSKLVIQKTENSNEIQQQYKTNAYTIRDYFRTAVICRSVKISEIPENDRMKYLQSALTSQLSSKCKSIIEDKLYAILYSEELAFEICNFRVEKGWFIDADVGCMVFIATRRVKDQLLIAAASCEATQQQASLRFLTQIFSIVKEMTNDNLKMLLKAICIEEIEQKQKQNNCDFIEFRSS